MAGFRVTNTECSRRKEAVSSLVWLRGVSTVSVLLLLLFLVCRHHGDVHSVADSSRSAAAASAAAAAAVGLGGAVGASGAAPDVGRVWGLHHDACCCATDLRGPGQVHGCRGHD